MSRGFFVWSVAVDRSYSDWSCRHNEHAHDGTIRLPDYVLSAFEKPEDGHLNAIISNSAYCA